MSTISLEDRLDDLFATLFSLRPVDASFVGHHEYDRILPDFSSEGIALHRQEIDRLVALFPLEVESGSLDAAEMDRRVAAGYLASQQQLLASGHAPFRDPSTVTGIAVLGLIGLLRRNFASAQDRLDRALDRIQGIPAFLEHAAAAAKSAPAIWSATALPHCIAGEWLCREGLLRFCQANNLLQPDASQLEASALAFRSLADTLRNTSATESHHPGCGQALLDLLLETTHHVSGGAATVTAIALAEIESARESMNRQAQALDSDWQTILQEVQSTIVPESEVLARHYDLFDAHRKLVTEKELLTWPDCPVTFTPVPCWLGDIMGNAGVYPYHAAAPAGEAVDIDFIIPNSPEGTPDFTILSNHVLHHAGVGHHVQNWFAYNRAKTRFGKLSAVDSAGYIFIHSGIGMAEGWSSYVPGMIAEFGIADEKQKVCMQYDRLRSAARGLVDVRLHSGTWSIDQAVEFLIEQTGANKQLATAAVHRISQSPSSGSMYCVGPAILRHLRRKLVGDQPTPAELGKFHDAFLSFGSLPLPLVAEAMTELSASSFLRSMTLENVMA